jgi:competence protein ComEC
VTPLPIIAAAFLVGLFAGGSVTGFAPAAVAIGVLIAIVAGERRWRSLAALGIVVSAALAGASRRTELPPLVPRARASPETDRLQARVVRGCIIRGEDAVCTVIDDAGRSIEMRVPRGRCDARPGDRLVALATRQPIQPIVNGARAGPGASLVRRGVFWSARAERCEVVTRGWSRPIDGLRRAGLWVRELLSHGLARVLAHTDAARADALLFGDESGLDELDGEAFRDSGLTHLLAVSGAHVALLASVLGASTAWLLRRIRRVAERGRIATVATVVPLAPVLVFVMATGESASAMRALVSAMAAAVARVAYRRARGEVLVAASVLVTLALDPAYAFDPGWQLSIVAAWALAASPRAPEAKATTALGAMRDFFTESLVASARVAVAAAPVLAWQFQRVPFTALAANAIAAPLAEGLALPAVLITGTAGTIAVPAGRLLGKCTAALLDGMFVLPHLALKLPGATAVAPSPTPTQCIVLVGTTLVAMRTGWRARGIWAACAVACVLALEWPHRVAAHPRDVVRVTMLDVGQGDSILVDLPDGEAVLVDAGGGFGRFDPGARVVIPWLADMRRRHLAAVVASHPHPDHIGGMPAVLAWGDVAELWDTRQGETIGEMNGSYGAMRAMAARRGVRVLGPESLCGAGRPFHGVLLDVLAPCPAVEEGTPPNDASFVLRLRFGAASVLLPGDLERAGEARVLDALGPVTLLKLGHHGSRTSTTDAWLDRLQPRVAIASAGHPSPFGHPHTAVVDRLAARAIPLWTTTERGGVQVTLHRDGTFEVAPAR